jgi:hypothetical protein
MRRKPGVQCGRGELAESMTRHHRLDRLMIGHVDLDPQGGAARRPDLGAERSPTARWRCTSG